MCHDAVANVVLRREAFYASALTPALSYWPVNFCSTWHGRRSPLFQNGGLIFGESTHRQPAQRHKEYAPGNGFLLAVELLFTLAVARVSDSRQGAKMP